MKKPLGSIMDIIKSDIERTVFQSMNENNLPASLMEYILASVMCKVKEEKTLEYAREFVEIEQTIEKDDAAKEKAGDENEHIESDNNAD